MNTNHRRGLTRLAKKDCGQLMKDDLTFKINRDPNESRVEFVRRPSFIIRHLDRPSTCFLSFIYLFLLIITSVFLVLIIGWWFRKVGAHQSMLTIQNKIKKKKNVLNRIEKKTAIIWSWSRFCIELID